MTSRNAPDIVAAVGATYCGATARLLPEQGLELGPDFAYQPKLDGVYCVIETDDNGRARSFTTRNGRSPWGAGQHSDLVGAETGLPCAVLIGELEAHTEAGIRSAATRGYPVVHLFDALRIGNEPVDFEPYRKRRSAMQRVQAMAEPSRPPMRVSVGKQGERYRVGQRLVSWTPRDFRRFPIVPQVPAAQAEQLWREYVELGGGEGVVAVSLSAPAGARMAKRKIKRTDTFTAVVLEVTKTTARVYHAGRSFTVKRAHDAKPGDRVDIQHNGWYESVVVPRFARIERVRVDL